MKKLGLIISALALVLGMSQCTNKPNMPKIGDGKTTPKEITFSVNGNDGQKGDFTQVSDVLDYTWSSEDKIYVYASGEELVEDNQTDFSAGQYCGILDLIEGEGIKTAKFKGTINVQDETKTLRFVHYGTGVTIDGNATTGYSGSASFAIQNGELKGENSISSKVIALCDKEYDENQGEYNVGVLTVQFGVVKFTFKVFEGYDNITLSGIAENGLKVNANGNIEYNEGTTSTLGGITVGNKEMYYTVFMPKGKTTYTFTDGSKSVFKKAEIKTGIFYTKTGEVGGSVTLDEYPEGLLSGKFTVNNTGSKVQFSKGNLQYIGSGTITGESATVPYWRFATNQWDYIAAGPSAGKDSGNVSYIAGASDYNNSTNEVAVRDLFGVGTTGFEDTRKSNHENWYQTNYKPWSTSKGKVNSTYNNNGYGPDYIEEPYYNLTVENKSDWGYNAIFNGGNVVSRGWRTLTGSEWEFILTTRSTTTNLPKENSRYSKVKVNGANGLLIYPDNFTWDATTMGTAPSSNQINVSGANYPSASYSDTEFAAMENAGVVFLPVTCSRDVAILFAAGTAGNYWSSTCVSATNASYLNFGNTSLNANIAGGRYMGRAVRLVYDVE